MAWASLGGSVHAGSPGESADVPQDSGEKRDCRPSIHSGSMVCVREPNGCFLTMRLTWVPELGGESLLLGEHSWDRKEIVPNFRKWG